MKIPLDNSNREERASYVLSLLHKEFSFTHQSINDKVKEQLYTDLSVLLYAGIDLKTALELSSNDVKKKQVKKWMNEIVEAVINGKSLSDVMNGQKQFSPYECISVKIGEETGKLAHIFKELSAHFSKRIKLKRQLISVFTYPSFLLAVTIGVLYFMLNNVVPMFAEVFERFGKDLPSFTTTIIQASEVVKNWSIPTLLIILIIVFILYPLKRKGWFRKYSCKLLLNIPIIGQLIHKIYLARFSQSMELLIGAKVPLIDSLKLVREMINFYPMEVALDEVESKIITGNSLHQSMSKYPIFERRMISLIRVAEEVNKLDEIFARLSEQYNNEVEHRTSVLGSLVEPIMILIIGIIVGVILIAMYQPLFNISNILE